MKKSIKIISILLIALMMIAIVTPVFAEGETEKQNVTFRPSEVTPQAGTNEANKIKDVGNSITGIIRIVGTVIAVAILIVLGIKYMMGSAEEKAEYKKTLFPYIVGAVLIFAASNLADVVYTWASNI